MKRTTTAWLVSGALMASGTSFAKDYGDTGTIEIGGELELSQTSTKLEDKDLNAEVDTTDTNVTVSPTAYYYLTDGLPLILALDVGLGMEKDNDDDSSEDTSAFGVGLGSGYLVKIGAARLGPAAILSYATETQKAEDSDGNKTEVTTAGPRVQAGGIAKLPIGGGGVITAALFLDYAAQTREVKDVDGEADVTTVGFGTSIGVSVWF